MECKLNSIRANCVYSRDHRQIEEGAINTERELHLRKAQVFYDKKKNARISTKNSETSVALAMDYSKNLPLPIVSSNDVYYKRQLSVYLFNIHNLTDNDSCFFIYDETVAKKGSNDVCSMLQLFLNSFVSDSVKHLTLFCDSCGGQNKNYTVFRFLYYLVNTAKRFQSLHVIYPIRGHSYMECDKNFSLINQKSKVYTVDEWAEVAANSRKTPSPFKVISCLQDTFYDYSSFLSPQFKAKCPVAIQRREFKVESSHTRQFLYREAYHGPWQSCVFQGPQNTQNQPLRLERAYAHPLSLKLAKYNDLQVLKRFVDAKHHKFFDDLPHDRQDNNENDEMSDLE